MRRAIQLYSLRAVDATVPALLEQLGTTGYEGVEFAYRVPDADPGRVVAALERSGLRTAGAHVPIERFADVDETVRDYRALGCDRLVVPILEAASFADVDGVRRVATRLTDLADRLADRDVTLAYHNHDHEFTSLGDRTAYDELVESTPATVGLQVDVGLAALAGADPVALLERYADRIDTVHLKDYELEAGRSVDLGDGDVPVAACVRAAREADVSWAIVEFEDSPDPLASAARSLETLSDL